MLGPSTFLKQLAINPAQLRRWRRTILVACFVFAFVVVALQGQRPSAKRFAKTTLKQIYDYVDVDENDILPCTNLPGASDVMVTMKTGATEIHFKLPHHLKTTFRCIPHYAIYSDLPEIISDQTIYDALDSLPSSIVNKYAEFDLYRSLRAAKYEGFNLSTVTYENGQKPGWDLDKWKFLPLITKAYARKPDAKWFVFIEADTFLMWSNLLRYLSFLDPQLPEYRGAGAARNDAVFAHGGSGYILSAKTVQMAVTALEENESLYALPRDERFGDVVLANFLKHFGAEFTPADPLIQGESPTTMGYNEESWSRPVISYHHVDQEAVEQMWHFEQRWLRTYTTATTHLAPEAWHKSPPILHSDVFSAVVAPIIYSSPGLDEWDNLSNDRILTSPSSSFPTEDEDNVDDELNNSNVTARSPLSGHPDQHAYTSLHACERACLADTQCKQYSFRPGECRIGHDVRLGIEDGDAVMIVDSGEVGSIGLDEAGTDTFRPGMRSRWIRDRIEASRLKTVEEWVGSNEERMFHTGYEA